MEAKPRGHLSTNQRSWQGWEPGVFSSVLWCQGRASLNPGEAPTSIEGELRDSILCLSFFICKMDVRFSLDLLITEVL